MLSIQAVAAAREFDAAAGMLAKTGPQAERTLWAALRYFAEATPSASTLGTFAAQHGVREDVASREIGKLVALRLVERQSLPADERRKIFRVSTRGNEALEQDPFRSLARALAAQFSPPELAIVGLAIGKLAVRACEWGAAGTSEAVVGRLEEEFVAEENGRDDDRLRNSPPDMQDAAIVTPQSMGVVRALALIGGSVCKAGDSEDLSHQEWAALRYFATAPAELATSGGYAERRNLSRKAAWQAIVALKEKRLLANVAKEDGTPSRRITASRKSLAILHLDPNLKIARVFDSEFDADMLDVITQVMNVILEAAAQISRSTLTQLSHELESAAH